MDQVLSSDILEAQFGPTAVEVLYQDAAKRLICTKAIRDGQVLEISHVTFDQSGVAAFAAVHRRIVNGESMGKAFREAGIDFVRETRAAYKQILPAGCRQWFDSAEPATVVMVSVLAGPERTLYAEILETYSPAVHWPQAAAGKPAPGHRAIIQEVDKLLLGRPRQ